MNLIIIAFFGVLISSFVLIWNKKVKNIQNEEGVLHNGEIIRIKTIIGRPNRYSMDVNVKDNKGNSRCKVTTTNYKCQQYQKGDSISLLYVPRWDKYYWIEDSNKKITFPEIFLWIVISFFLIFIIGGIIAVYF